ncbi:MAG TPA: hypothetical protein PK644_06035, partial [bacterium]|nr:hypothetical protein [bacterium]
MNRQKLTGLLLFLLSLLCVTGTAAAFRLYLEAEEARDLQRYPYDNEDCPTWYGREANIRGWAAPGRAWCAAIHETATNIKAIL